MAESDVSLDGADVEVLDEEPRSILFSLISQLTKGADLHRVALPTFVLEPRSMLERITDFMAHPDIAFEARLKKDPVERFVQTLRFYLAGWHIRPKGVKKPYNPVLGEYFRCRWRFPDNSESFYIAEQVSHHPPISAFYYHSPEHGVIVNGEFRPKSKFLGNSAATLMHGGSRIRYTNYPGEVYEISNPNVYAKGLLFGKMMLELGDTSTVKCTATDLVAEMEFTTKGFFSGAYNGIRGKIKRISSGKVLYELSGTWSETIYIQRAQSADREVLFDVAGASLHQKQVAPEAQQDEYESRRLWSKLTAAILARDMHGASSAKAEVENKQREIRQARERSQQQTLLGPHEGHAQHQNRFFECINDLWLFKWEKELTKSSLPPAEAKKMLEKHVFGK